MRRASIHTNMNVYGKGLSDAKRQVNAKVVQMLLKRRPLRAVKARPQSTLRHLFNGLLIRNGGRS